MNYGQYARRLALCGIDLGYGIAEMSGQRIWWLAVPQSNWRIDMAN